MQPNPAEFEQQLYKFQYLKQQRDMFANQLDLLNASLGNLLNTKMTVENLKDVKDGEEILMPIGGMVNIKAIIKEPEKVLLYVNQDILIEKNLDDSREFIDSLIDQHKEQITFINTQVQNIDINLRGLSQAFQPRMPPK